MMDWIKNLFSKPTEAAKAALDVNKDGQVNTADAVAAAVKVEEVAVAEVKKVARKAGNAVKGKAKGKK
jgi:hypothetical protein